MSTPTATTELKRAPSRFTGRVTADGRSGWPVRAGRYRLVINRACPWAHRSAVVRRLMGLDEVISLGITDPVQEVIDGDNHWVFTEATGSPGDVDPVLGVHAVRDLYLATEPGYAGGVSVPVLVDTETGHLVSNDFNQLTIDLATQWGALARPGAPDLYPAAHRDEIDALAEDVYRDLNQAVYLAGFAPDQDRYDRTVAKLFARLDSLEDRLATRRFLVGDTITEADIRLFPTLVRFDAVYHGLFKCNRRKLIEYPALWAYARDLFQTPGFGDTTEFGHIRTHYYHVLKPVNPSGIVAIGPDPTGWLTEHHRDQLAGRPFGDGTPPGQPQANEIVRFPS
ncbi:glutathione-dependent reductase [Actinosynnema sp. ALI-1.44]|uniref:glutathione S-transferase family protein n=1 Tax=Actinosynnema sp. ALI-1.44 TaxID=1933779 RepID=UPI00097C15AB|nr:glutathione S-transferase C-terminal domain-containing protein [Actinosynnema sp. ALI-1.44]ONI76200.1 glutathione-dependent reductase [Actinosynnema sp. ALI-1.44]